MKKRLLALLLTGAMVASMAACGGQTTTTTPTSAPKATEAPKATTAPKATEAPKATDTPAPTATPIPVETLKFSQAPTIKSTVKVEDRLPILDDVFIEQVDCNGNDLEIGVYCGNLSWGNGGGSWDISRPMLETIVHYNVDGTYYPNVIKSFSYSDDYKVWTFVLRQGMKWSDGADFTAADIEFWYEQCHKTNWDGKASWTALHDDSTGNFATLTVVNAYTVTWTFDTAKYPGNFIENGDFKFCWAPKHYLEDLVPTSFYAASTISDEQAIINAKAKGISYDNVKDLGKNCVYYFWNTPGVPTLNPWVLSTQDGLNNRKTTCQLLRNEYYWKVDAAGQQLPYYDVLDMIKYGEDQQKLAFLSGDLDHLEVGMADISTLIAEAQASKTPFTPTLGVDASTAWGSEQITFNYTIADKNYADLFAKSEFRQALSISVDRTEIAGLITDNFLQPAQAAPGSTDVDYDAEWATKWTEYKPAEAKKLLEKCGLVMGSDGYYTFADGSKLQIDFYCYNTADSAAKNFSYYQKFFKAIGLNTTFTQYDVALYDSKVDANDWMACYNPHTSAGGKMVDRQAPIVPVSGAGGAEWYGNYGFYYETKGAEGTQPTGDMAKLVELYDKWVAAPTAAERSAIEKEIQNIHKENLWTIAFLESTPTYTLVSPSLHNYPKSSISIDKYMYSNIKHPWTFFEK